MSFKTEISKGKYFKFSATTELQNGSINSLYKWIGCNSTDGSSFYLVVEKEGITFYKYEYKDAFKAVIKNTVISISSIESQSNVKKTEDRLNIIYRKKTNEHYFEKNLIIHFLLDLYVFNAFNQVGENSRIKRIVENYPILKGIFYKQRFLHYVKYKDSKINGERENTGYYITEDKINEDGKLDLYKEYLKADYNRQKIACQEWISFLRDEKNELLFWNKRIKPHDQMWFDTLEEELDSVLTVIMDKNITLDQHQIQYRNLSRFLLKRYNVLGAIQYFGGPYSKPYHRSIPILFISVFVLIILDWILFNIGINKIKFTFPLSTALFIFIIIPILIIFYSIGLLVWKRISKVNKHNSSQNTIQSNKNRRIHSFHDSLSVLLPQIFLPRVTIAIISGWLIFFTASEMIDIDFFLDGFEIGLLFIFVVLASFVFMYNEIRNVAPSLQRKEIVKRISMVILISFIISYSFGYLFMPVANRMVENSDTFKNSYAEHTDIINAQNTIAEKNTELKNLYILKHLVSSFEDFVDVRITDNELNGYAINMNSSWSNQIRIYLQEGSLVSKKKLLEYVNQRMQERLNLIHSINIQLTQYEELNETFNLYTNYSVGEDHLNSDLAHIDQITRNLLWMTNVVITEIENQILLFEQQLKVLESQENFRNYFIRDSSRTVVLEKNNPFYWTQKTLYLNPDISNSYIMPNILMFRALMAFFIGITLQLVLQDKSITEPL